MKSIDLNKLLKEISFNFSRSSGKGGQNVNKVETKVELVFNLLTSYTLSDDAKKTIFSKLKNRLNNQGELKVTSQSERSQLGNRKKVIARFIKLIEMAMKKENVRIKTVKTLSSKEKRIEEKKIISKKKKERRVKDFDID